MKIFKNSMNMNGVETNNSQYLSNFRAKKIPVTVMNPNNWPKITSSALASISVASFAIAQKNEEQKYNEIEEYLRSLAILLQLR